MIEDIPGSVQTPLGPNRGQFNKPHVYARDPLSSSGNCVCGWQLGDDRHTEAAAGIPIPNEMRRRHG